MPVECNLELEPIGQEDFHALDKVVMGCSFEVHNTLGRFFDERIYQEELAERCRVDGMEVHREVQIRVSYGEFVKSYYLDLIINRGVIYELKAVDFGSASSACSPTGEPSWRQFSIRRHFSISSRAPMQASLLSKSACAAG